MQKANAKKSSGSIPILIGSIAIVLAVAALYPTSPLHRLIHESLMASATSAHYEFRFPPRALSPDSISELTAVHEKLFTTLDAKIGDAASTSTIRIIFDSASNVDPHAPAYAVDGTTIRTFMNGKVPTVDPTADAAALLNTAWGKPGNTEIANWTAHWLVGAGNTQELGMAAAGIDRGAGHVTVAKLLNQQSGSALIPQDRETMGTAWVSEIAELSGIDAVHKLYSAQLPTPDLSHVGQALGTSPTEIERKWQLWMFAYVAGMPGSGPSGMPPGMHMPTPTGK